jgi:TPR repeat protein
VAKKSKKHQLNAIQPGFQLHWYEIREIIGQGGFGITYLAYDRNLAHEVAIKEYMPIELAARQPDGSVAPLSQEHEERYKWGLGRFLAEARTIGQFKHPNIVRVRNVFETNNTAYMVMDYELGEALQDILSRRKLLDEGDLVTVMLPIMDGMKLVHAHGFIHRDIKPGNIFIRVDGDPVLLDFGSARQALETSRGSMTSLFSKGYAPIEQYNSNEEQGPWTDIYALGATMYRCIAGVPPADAIDRSSAISVAGRDTYVPAVEVGEGRYSRPILEAIDYAMRFRRHERPQSIGELLAVMRASSESSGTGLPASANVSAAVVADRAVRGPGAPVCRATPVADGAEPRGNLAATVTEQKGPPVVADQDRTEPEKESPAPAPVPLPPEGDEEFMEHYERAMDGDVEALSDVAYRYAKGIGIEKNEAEAVNWYQRAAEQGYAPAQFSLGVMYAKGRGVEQDFRAAFKWYLKSAAQGDVSAQAAVAGLYSKGVGTPPDPAAAFDWTLRAAKNGHLQSACKVGEMYAQGLGTKQDPEEAVRWFKRAAEKGMVDAQMNLAFMYGKGQGVERDDSLAFKWYRKAAESGNPTAQFNLGVIYSKGRGMPPDPKEARRWYQRAADQGDPNAERALAKLGRE